jgi:hypothetical protein
VKVRWNVAYTFGNWRTAVLWRHQKIANPEGHFLADPFAINRNGRNFCFVEDYDSAAGLGQVAVYEITSNGAVSLGAALTEPFHLSFPFVFTCGQNIYMCPETASNRDIRIYKCIDFPLRWRLEKILIQNIDAADSMLFEQRGKWWMFTNTDSAGDGDYCSEFSIFHADHLLGDWKPHPLNPIFVDAARARNAGLLKDGDTYYRVSQGQGFDRYGVRTLINEIVDLTEENYAETTIATVTSAFEKRAIGTHHFHSDGEITVFDFACVSRWAH